MNYIYFEWYFGFFVPFSGIEWYFKLPLTVPLSPADISLILNGIQWYTIGSFFVRACVMLNE